MASIHDFELTKNLLKCPWGAQFSDEFNLNIVEENGFSPSSDSSSELEKCSRQQIFQFSPYRDECVLARCKLKICRKLVKAQNLLSHITDYHRLSREEYIKITNLDGRRKTNNLDDDDEEDDVIKMINNFECDPIKIKLETDQFKTKKYNHGINIFRNYEKNCINSNGIVPFRRFVDSRKRPLVDSTQSTAKKKVKLNPNRELRWVRIISPPTMAGIVQAQRYQGLTYSISRKFHKSPAASMHGNFKLLKRRHRIVYPSYKMHQMQMVDVIKQRNSYFQNADDEAGQSSVSSLKNKESVHPIHPFISKAKSSDNHNSESNNNPLTYSKMVHYRRKNCRRKSSSDKLNTPPPRSLSNKVVDKSVTEDNGCPVLRIKSLGLHRPKMAEPDVDACSSSTSSNNVITDEERSSSLEERSQSEEDVTSDSDVKCSSDDETNETSSSPSEQPSEDEQDEEKDVSFLDEREEHDEHFSKRKCFSVPNSDSPTPKECEIETETFLGVKKESSSSDSCSSAESSVEDSENEDLSNDDEEEETSEEDEEEEKDEMSDEEDEEEEKEMSDEENEVKKEEIFNKVDEVENKQVFSKDVEVSGKKSDEEEEVFKDDNDNWWDRRSSLTCASSNMSINWSKNSKFNLISFKSPPSKLNKRVQPVYNKQSVITHTSNMSNKSVGTRLSKEEPNFGFEEKVLVARTAGFGVDKSTDNPKEELKPDDLRKISPISKELSKNSVKNSAPPITPKEFSNKEQPKNSVKNSAAPIIPKEFPNKEQPALAKNSNSIPNPSTSTTPVESQPKKKPNIVKSDSTSVINRKFSLKNNHFKFHMPHTLFSSFEKQDKTRDEMLRKIELPDPSKEPFKQPILSPISFSNRSAIQKTSVPKPNNIHAVQAVKAHLGALVHTTNGNINQCDKVANFVARKHPPVNGIKWNKNHLNPEHIVKMQGDKDLIKMQLKAINSCIDRTKHLKVSGVSSGSEAEREIILGIKKKPFIDPSISSSKLPLGNSFSKMRKDSSNVTICKKDNKDKQYLNSGPVIQNGY